MSLESMHAAEVELVQYNEDSMNAVDRRDGAAPPGSKATSCTKGHRWDWRDPAGSVGEGHRRGCKAREDRSLAPNRGRESDRSIVPLKPSKELP